MITDPYKKRLRELIVTHDEFSNAVKLVEQFAFEIDYASLNDARYALRAIIDCLKALLEEPPKENKFLSAFSAAKHALNVAWHDIVDIAHIEFKLYLDKLCEKYGADLVAGAINVSDYKKLIHKIEDIVRESRADRSVRHEVYRKITTGDLEEMLSLYRQAVDAEPSIAALRKKEVKKNFYMMIGAITGLMIGLAALLGIIVKFTLT